MDMYHMTNDIRAMLGIPWKYLDFCTGCSSWVHTVGPLEHVCVGGLGEAYNELEWDDIPIELSLGEQGCVMGCQDIPVGGPNGPTNIWGQVINLESDTRDSYFFGLGLDEQSHDLGVQDILMDYPIYEDEINVEELDTVYPAEDNYNFKWEENNCLIGADPAKWYHLCPAVAQDVQEWEKEFRQCSHDENMDIGRLNYGIPRKLKVKFPYDRLLVRSRQGDCGFRSVALGCMLTRTLQMRGVGIQLKSMVRASREVGCIWLHAKTWDKTGIGTLFKSIRMA